MQDNEALEMVFLELDEQCVKTIEALKKQLGKVRTGRASISLLDDIKADYYGVHTPLRQMANITVPEPRMIIIVPYEVSSLKDLEKAIIASGLGLNPQNDGKVLRLVIPELTGERRKELGKVIGKISEEHRISIRRARKDSINSIKQLEKDKEINEDESHKAQKDVQKQVDDAIKKVDEITAVKEKEILEV